MIKNYDYETTELDLSDPNTGVHYSLERYKNLRFVRLPKYYKNCWGLFNRCTSIEEIVAPGTPKDQLLYDRRANIRDALTTGFINHHSEYERSVAEDYVEYLSTVLPNHAFKILKNDDTELLAIIDKEGTSVQRFKDIMLIPMAEAMKAEKCLEFLKNLPPKEKKKTVVFPMVGSKLQFGSYAYDFGKQAKWDIKIHDTKLITTGVYERPINWTVLAREEDRALILSDNVIDFIPFNMTGENTSWTNCSLRTWLNKDFIAKAFSEDEQNRILTVSLTTRSNPLSDLSSSATTKDRVFLLSTDEVETLFAKVKYRKCNSTPYAASSRDERSKNRIKWLLRTSGQSTSYAAAVDVDGNIDYIGDKVGVDACGLRPAMWIKTDEIRRE